MNHSLLLSTIYLFISLVFSPFVSAGEWYEDWPTELFEDTEYYRGQRTDLASFDRLVKMLVDQKSSEVVTSRMFRTLEKLYPNEQNDFLKTLSDRQYQYWLKERLLGWIADCHADPYMCRLPKVEKLMGEIFIEDQLPVYILELLKKERGESFDQSLIGKKADILSFFDPIVSTSYRLDIAESFGLDRDGFDGYVLILNDQDHRNCSFEEKKVANCFINNEEFMEELEFPMWSYITPKELNGFIVNRWEVRKATNGLTLKDKRTKKIKSLYGSDKKSCSWLNKWSPKLPKVDRLKASLLKGLQCSAK